MWGVHSQDTIWHIALANVAFQHFPFQMPVAVGESLRGYNFLLDLFVFLGSRVGISASTWYFKIIPIAWFIIFTVLTIKIGKKIHGTLYSVCLLFFFYFGGSFAYFFTLRNSGSIWESSGMVALQSAQTLLNLQLAVSLLCFLSVVYLILIAKLTLKTTLLFAGIAAISIGIKFYGGVIIAFAICIYYLYLFARLRKISLAQCICSLGIILAAFVIMAVVVYDPIHSAKTGSPFAFAPFALTHSIVEEPTLFYLPNLVNARYFLQSIHKFSPRLVGIELLTVTLFLFFNFGTRIIGIFSIVQREKKDDKKKALDFVLKASFVFSLSLALLLVQKGEWWNTIQFFYYTLFFAGFFAAETLFVLVKKPSVLKLCLAFIIILATLPTTLDSLHQYLLFPAHDYISKAELEGLSVIAQQPPGVVYASLYNKDLRRQYVTNPIPLFAADDTSYVAAYSNHSLYYANYNVLNISGIAPESRIQEMKQPNCAFLSQFSYAYILKKKNDTLFGCDALFQNIFENTEVIVYKKAL